MIILFQLAFLLFSIMALIGVYKKFQQQSIIFPAVIFWCIFWVLANIVVWYPDVTSRIASLLGIGRGVDLIMYIAIAVLFYLMFRLQISLERTQRIITEITRKKAIESIDVQKDLEEKR